MARVARAWWPGGRTAQKAAVNSPASRRPMTLGPAPAASSAASPEAGLARGGGAGARAPRRGVPRGGARPSVRVEPPAPAAAEPLESLDIGPVVDELYLRLGGRPGRHGDQLVAEPGAVEAAVHGTQTLGALGVAESGVVGQVLRVGDEGERHPAMTVKIG